MRLEKFDGAIVRSVDSSTMKHSLQSYNQNESAGMSHMLRALGKSLSCFVPLQVDAELSCNVELNCAAQLIAASIAASKLGVAYVRSPSNHLGAGSSPHLQQGATIHVCYNPRPRCGTSCAGLARFRLQERIHRDDASRQLAQPACKPQGCILAAGKDVSQMRIGAVGGLGEFLDGHSVRLSPPKHWV